MLQIRNYNKSVGSYQNTTIPVAMEVDGQSNSNALLCKQIEINGLTYSVECTSAFLNSTAGNKYFTEITRNRNFELWSDQDYCANASCISRSNGVGPSWK